VRSRCWRLHWPQPCGRRWACFVRGDERPVEPGSFAARGQRAAGDSDVPRVGLRAAPRAWADRVAVP
jgi:hypothetical protein